MKSSSDLRRELAQAEAREREERKRLKDATPPKFSFYALPAQINANGQYSYGKLYDPTCVLYNIGRSLLNGDDARAAGWASDELKEGSAVYIYNVVTRRIICAVGGGTHYIRGNDPFGKEDFADDSAFFAIGAYLAEFPGGGDITWIFDQYRADRRQATANGTKTVNNF